MVDILTIFTYYNPDCIYRDVLNTTTGIARHLADGDSQRIELNNMSNAVGREDLHRSNPLYQQTLNLKGLTADTGRMLDLYHGVQGLSLHESLQVPNRYEIVLISRSRGDEKVNPNLAKCLQTVGVMP